MMDELELHPAEHDEIAASEVTLDFVAKIRPAVGTAILDDEAILLDPATGISHLLNASGTLVLRCMDGEVDLRTIADDIADVLELDQEPVRQDVLGLVRELGGHGLVEGIERDAHAGHDHPRMPEGVPVGADLGGWGGWSALGPAEGDVVLVNWGTAYGFCTRISGELAELEPRLADAGVRLVLVTTGDQEALRAQVGDLELPALHVDEVPEFFAGLGTPVAYRIGRDRTVSEPIAVGADQVPTLVRRCAEG